MEETLESGKDIDERYMIPGLSRGLAVLSLFTREKREWKLTEIAEGLDVSRSAAYRLVYTLEKDHFLRRDPLTRRYRLTAKVLSLGFELLFSASLTDLAQPHLTALSETTRAAAHLVILEGWQVVYLARAAPSIALISNLQIGARLPAHLTASGRIQLAFLQEEHLRAIWEVLSREAGSGFPRPETYEVLRRSAEEDRVREFVFSRSHFDPSVYSLACVVRGRSGVVAAAINVVAPLSAVEEFGGPDVLREAVERAASELSTQLGFRA